MVRLAVYGGVSTFLAFSIVAAAFRQRSNFYAACIYLSKSSACLMILMNMGFFLTIVFGQILQSIFFGQLRAVEIEHLFEKSWYAVTETCLAMTIFRDEFDARFIVTFTTLLFLKIFHWLCQDRVGSMEQSPVVPMSFHIRMVALMEILSAADGMLMLHAIDVTMKKGPNMMIMFAFEYSILGATMASTFFKYVLNIIDMRREEPWENKSIYVFYLELVTDLFKLITYLIFFAIILIFYGLPLHIIRDVYVTFRSFLQKCGDLVRYRRATRNMNERYPSATSEELERLTDHTCIICRDDMVAATPADANNNDGQEGDAAGRTHRRQPGSNSGDTPKKLPCGHIFHFHCLRSWLERQQSCPTCRRPVLSEVTQQQQPRQGQNQRNGAAAPPAPAQPHIHGMPGIQNFPGGFIGNPIIGFPPMMMFQPPALQGHWGGPPVPIVNANVQNPNPQRNEDNVGSSPTMPQPTPPITTGDQTSNNVEATSSSSSSTQPQPNTNQTSSTSPQRIQPTRLSSTLPNAFDSSQPPLSSSNFATPTQQSPIPIPTAPPPHMNYSQYPTGLISLFPMLPPRNIGATATDNTSSSPTMSLENLSDEQIRLLESNTREGLAERIRILQNAQGQISDVIALLTQAVSALPPQVLTSETTTNANSSFTTNNNTRNSSDPGPSTSSSLEDEKDKKGKGKSVTISSLDNDINDSER